MARFTLISAVLFAVGRLVSINAPNSLLGLIELVGLGGLAVSGVYYGIKGLQWVSGKLLWTVRSKLILSYTFIGLIPVLILAVIAWFSIGLIFRQLSVVYLENELELISRALHDASERIVLRFYQSDSPQPERLLELMREERESLIRISPGLGQLTFSALQPVPQPESMRYLLLGTDPPGDAVPSEEPTVPQWARSGFDGIIAHQGRLHFRGVLSARRGNREYLVMADLPLDQKLFDHLHQKTEIGVQLVDLSSGVGSAAFSDFFGSQELLNIRWAHILQPVDWSNETEEVTDHGILLEVPLEKLFQRYFFQTSGFGQAILWLIAILGVVFVLVELTSLFVGFAIARSITRSIHNIYAGARNIEAGNFDFRIPSHDRDQLDSMATAFNRMSESVVELMNEVTEKERLDKEIEIAREVQAHLFPRELPKVKCLQLAGECLPARRVSGDYYDFIPYGENELDIIIADISGKGISAALLMANLQSSIRSHALHQATRSDGSGSVAAAVGAINRQLYTHTSPDKFATLVMSRIKAPQMELTYCNAGHNPPLIISDGKIRKMNVGGMVAGLFENPDYQQETVKLRTGDLVAFYTDGVVEAENPRGEQFGEERLEYLLRTNSFLTADDISGLIIEEIRRWSQGREQRDDITVVALKVTE